MKWIFVSFWYSCLGFLLPEGGCCAPPELGVRLAPPHSGSGSERACTWNKQSHHQDKLLGFPLYKREWEMNTGYITVTAPSMVLVFNFIYNRREYVWRSYGLHLASDRGGLRLAQSTGTVNEVVEKQGGSRCPRRGRDVYHMDGVVSGNDCLLSL